jgi:hypothetical protein
MVAPQPIAGKTVKARISAAARNLNLIQRMMILRHVKSLRQGQIF